MKVHMAEIVAVPVGSDIAIQAIVPMTVLNAFSDETVSGMATLLDFSRGEKMEVEGDHLVITLMHLPAEELRNRFPSLFQTTSV
jgi:hypothetical protein